MQNALHFVGFVHPDQGKDPRYEIARRAFGTPDFVHRYWDVRAWQEVAPGDMVVYTGGKKANCEEEPFPHAFDDSSQV